MADFLASNTTPLARFYLVAVALNLLAAGYAGRCLRHWGAAGVWLLVSLAFGGLAWTAYGGHPLQIPESVKAAIDACLGPVTFTVGSWIGLGVLLIGRRTVVRPGVAWGLFNGSLVFLGASLSDPHFAATVTKPDNLPIVAMVYLLAFFTWLATYQAVKNDDRLAQGQPPIEKEFSATVLVWPDLIYVELIGMVLGTAILIAWALLVRAPLEAPANPGLTPNPSKAPWYFVGLQEMLAYFDPSIAGVILPATIILGLMAIPYLDVNPQGNGYYTIRQRWFAYLLFQFGFLELWIVLILIGTFFRGPNWNFFGLYEPHDPHKAAVLTNVTLSQYFWVHWLGRSVPEVPRHAGMLRELAWIAWRELPGVLFVIGYFGALPAVLGRTVLHGIRQQMGRGRYVILTLLLLMMILLPLKMILRWSFQLNYLLSIPEYFFNL